MSQNNNENCCWTIKKFSFFYDHFAIIDTEEYLADSLFIKHQIRVRFGPEFVCPDVPYRLIMCKCRKRDVGSFLAAISELPNKMLLYSHPDYLTFCEDLKRKITAAKENGGVIPNETACASEQTEQEGTKSTSCQTARELVWCLSRNPNRAQWKSL